jgi:hypothetical protein
VSHWYLAPPVVSSSIPLEVSSHPCWMTRGVVGPLALVALWLVVAHGMCSKGRGRSRSREGEVWTETCIADSGGGGELGSK